MPKINSDQLEQALRRGLRSIYLVAGDEPLLVQEACDRIRQTAREGGFTEREIYHTDPHFSWGQLSASASSLSLFADRKLLEVRLHSSKLVDAGAQVFKAFCERPVEETLVLVSAPKLDRGAAKSGWVQAIEKCGLLVTVWPVSEQNMTNWLRQRLQRTGLEADRAALEILKSRTQSNLLAAAQEIEKLRLLDHQGVIDASTMAHAVADSARFDVFSLVDKALLGDPQGVATHLQGLKAEGSEVTVILWAISRDIRALAALKHAQHRGLTLESVARQHGVFDFRLPVVRGALQRLDQQQLRTLIRLCAYVDRCIKGLESDDPWTGLLEIGLRVAGTGPTTAGPQGS